MNNRSKNDISGINSAASFIKEEDLEEYDVMTQQVWAAIEIKQEAAQKEYQD